MEPGPLEEAERSELESFIDAQVAGLYGLSEGDVNRMLSDFTAASVTPIRRERILELVAAL